MRRRLLIDRVLTAFCWTGTGALSVAAIAIIADHYFPLGLDRWPAIGIAATAGLVAAVAWAWFARPNLLDSAIELDRRCQLDERVSTALALDTSNPDNAAVSAAVADDAQQRLSKVNIAASFPMGRRREAWRPIVPLAAAWALAVLLSPKLPTGDPAATAEEPAPAEVKAEVASLERKLDERQREAERLQLIEAEKLLERARQETAKLQSAEKLDRKEALVKLNDVARQMEERRRGLDATEEMKKQLSRLRSKKSGPADKFAEALARGQFNAALERLQQMREAIESGKLDEQQKKDLQEQLDQLQKQVEQMAAAQQQQQREMAKRLQQKPEQKPGDAQRREGSEPAEGAEPGAAEKGSKREGEKPEGRPSEPDAAALAEQLAQAGSQSERLEDLAEALSEAAQGLQDGDSAKAQEGLGKLSQQLEQLAQEAAEAQLLDEGLRDVADCKSGLCREGQPQDGPGQNGRATAEANPRPQNGGSQAGVGRGPGDAREPQPTATGKSFDSVARSQMGPGELRPSGPADGPNSRGRVMQAIREQSESFAESEPAPLENQPLDRSRRQQKRQYFDALRGGD